MEEGNCLYSVGSRYPIASEIVKISRTLRYRCFMRIGLLQLWLESFDGGSWSTDHHWGDSSDAYSIG